MKAKHFDCVEMKHQIQRVLPERYGKLDCAERNRLIHEALRSDAHLGRLLQLPATNRGEEPGRPSSAVNQ